MLNSLLGARSECLVMFGQTESSGSHSLYKYTGGCRGRGPCSVTLCAVRVKAQLVQLG